MSSSGSSTVQPVFEILPWRAGVVADLELRTQKAPGMNGSPQRFEVLGWTGCEMAWDDAGAGFGWVVAGNPRLHCDSGAFCLTPGMYFTTPGGGRLEEGPEAANVLHSASHRAVVVRQAGFKAFFQLGGPVEDQGRLRYIDGCSDSLLAAPILKGDACLNLLCIPPQTRQSWHTHPSFRLGTVLAGAGRCLTPEGEIPMRPGDLFVIHADGLHCFHTDEQPLTVLAFHPDSDFGPTHEDHPMLNRTYLTSPAEQTSPSIPTSPRIGRRSGD